MLVHQTGLCMPPEMVGIEKMHVLELFRDGWGFFGAPSCLQSVEPEQGVPNSTSAAQFGEISARGDTCSARIDTRRPTVEDARRSRDLLSCLQGVFRVPLMPIA